MDSLKKYIRKDALLHAYGVEGDCDVCEQALTAFMENDLGIVVHGNPDYQTFSYDVLGVDEARMLKEVSLVRAFGDAGKFFVIRFSSSTREAQNALLKLFEEPTDRTHFFLVFPSAELLLPTLRSRLFLIHLGGAHESKQQAQTFVRLSSKERLDFLKEIIERKDKEVALSFLNELEVYLHNELREKKKIEYTTALKNIEQTRGYLSDRAPSVKMLLEYVALSIPVLRKR